MSNEEAIEILGDAEFLTHHDADYAIRIVDAIEKAQDALNKQIPKPVIKHQNDWECPCCGNDELNFNNKQVGRCKCGQALIF